MKGIARRPETALVAWVAFLGAGPGLAQTAPPPHESRLYLAAIAAADATLRLHDTRAARRWLAEAPASLRGFEWSYLDKLADESLERSARGPAINDVAISPDGALAASTATDGSVTLWARPALTRLRSLVGHAAAAWGVAFSPDGRTLATGSSDGTVRLWNVGDGSPVRSLSPTGRGITAVAFSPDGSALATTSWDRSPERGVFGVIRIWDPRDGRLVHSMEHGVKPIVTVAWSVDGSLLAAGTWDDDTSVWNTSGWTLFRKLQPAEKEPYKAVQGIAFSLDGRRIAVAAKDGAIRVWDVAKGEVLKTLVGQAEGQSQWINDAVFLDGARLASVSQDGTVRLWDTDTGQEISARHGHTSGVTSIVRGSDGRLLTGSLDGTIRTWDPDSSRVVPTTENMYGLAFSPDGSRVATTGWKGRVRIFDTRTNREISSFAAHGQSGVRLDWSRDGRRFATTGNDGKTILWDAERGEKGVALQAIPNGRVEPVVFHPDSTLVAAPAPAGGVRIFRVPGGDEAASLGEGGAPVTDLNWSPDGAALAVAASDGRVTLWDWKSRTARATLAVGKGTLSVAFAPSGLTLAVGSSDRTITLWDSRSGRKLHTLEGHDEAIHNLVYSPDGQRIASASSDHTVRLWDPVKGRLLMTIPFPEAAFNLAWSPDGRRIAVLVLDRTLRFVDGGPGD